MNKTLTINLSGLVFHIDEDAYEKLRIYLYNINRHFGGDADAKEIVEDIESRIAEIFTEKVKSGSEVISFEHVTEVISIMGTPEAISNEEEEKAKSKVADKRINKGRNRRLYRDADDRVLGGVCSGLGSYFSVDPVIIRIIFVLIFLFPIGSGVLIYLVLWIVVPKASTTSQRLEMKGEEVNIDNISKSIKEEMQDVKENFKNYRSNPAYSQSRSGIHEVGNVFLNILKIIGTILLVIIGIPFVFVGVILLIILFSLLFASTSIIGFLPFNHGVDHLNLLFAQGTTLTWIWVGLLLVISVPLINLIYLGIKMIFHIKSRNHIFGSISAGLFFVGLIILFYYGSTTLGEFSKNATVSNTQSINCKSDTLYLSAKHGDNEKELEAIIDEDMNFNHFKLGVLNGKDIMIGSPEFRVEKSENNEMNFTINKVSRGYNLNNARQNADDISFKYQVKDSLINIQPSYILPNLWRNQRVNLKLNIPVGKTIYLDESLKNILWDVKNTTDTYDYDMVNKYWTMKPDGLTLVNRALPPSSKSTINKTAKK